MEYSVKKYKGNWLVDDNNGGWVGFADHDEAMQYCYDNGATKVMVQYTPFMGRTYTREALENFKLVRSN